MRTTSRRALAALAISLFAFGALPATERDVLAEGPPGAPAPAASPAPSPAAAAPLTIERAVAIALQRNREIIAARLDIDAAQVDRIAAGLYWNPNFFYTAGNLVIPNGNPQGQGLSPGPFSQIVHTVGVSEVVDLWAKRSYRVQAADLGVEYRRLRVEDVLREVILNVRSAFADLVREQDQHELVSTIKLRYDETVRVAQSRVRAGEISPAEGTKFELEGLKYDNELIDSETQLDIARRELSTLLALDSTTELGGDVIPPPIATPRVAPAFEPLLARAFQQRPDFRAANKGRELGEAELSAARREGFPDVSLGLAYTHSEFTVSGDNGNTLAATVSMSLPIFDHNQAGIARADLEIRRTQNELSRLELLVRHDVAEAVRRVERAAKLLDVYEAGGMLSRADGALRAAEASYKAGAVSLLELLEAQRTFIETRMQYLEAQDDYRKAIIEVSHAVGEKLP